MSLPADHQTCQEDRLIQIRSHLVEERHNNIIKITMIHHQWMRWMLLEARKLEWWTHQLVEARLAPSQIREWEIVLNRMLVEWEVAVVVVWASMNKQPWTQALMPYLTSKLLEMMEFVSLVVPVDVSSIPRHSWSTREFAKKFLFKREKRLMLKNNVKLMD